MKTDNERTIITKIYFCPFCGQKLTDPIEVEMKEGENLYEQLITCFPFAINP